MKFIFMIYHDENVLEARPDKEVQTRVQGGTISITDGPFAETKEQLEVRPVQELTHS